MSAKSQFAVRRQQADKCSWGEWGFWPRPDFNTTFFQDAAFSMRRFCFRRECLPTGKADISAIGLRNSSIGLHISSIGLHIPAIGLRRRAIGLRISPIGLHRRAIGLHSRIIGLRSPPVGLTRLAPLS